MAPQRLASLHQSLPPILHIMNQSPVPGYSKGSRGLSVLSRVVSIFTVITISPRLLLRQWGSRYTIRAGRNLPDKEFRYLRTVIVTAAVYRGFDSELAPILLTFRHRAGVRPYTSACALAESCVFGKQSLPPILCNPPQLRAQAHHQQGHTFSRSYGINLPSSLARVLPSALEFSSHPPESVYGTVSTAFDSREAFPGSIGSPSFEP